MNSGAGAKAGTSWQCCGVTDSRLLNFFHKHTFFINIRFCLFLKSMNEYIDSLWWICVFFDPEIKCSSGRKKIYCIELLRPYGKWLNDTALLSHPQSKDAIASKNWKNLPDYTALGLVVFVSTFISTLGQSIAHCVSVWNRHLKRTK